MWHRAATWCRPVPFGTITAIDQQPAFLSALDEAPPPLLASVVTHAADFSELPFPRESLDLIWSEGAIYTLGFAAGQQPGVPF